MIDNAGFHTNISVPTKPLTNSFAYVFSVLPQGSHVISHHEIENGVIGAGRFIDNHDICKTLSKITDTQSKEVWVDERILFEDVDTLVWYKKATNTPTDLWFRSTKNTFSLSVLLPTLIFIKSKSAGTLHIFACAQRGRPTPNTRLYNAPLCNTSATGSFCWGGATPPVTSDNAALIEGTEAEFFGSAFSHTSNGCTFAPKYGRITNMREHIAIWEQLVERKQRPKASDLTPNGLTLKAAIEGRM